MMLSRRRSRLERGYVIPLPLWLRLSLQCRYDGNCIYGQLLASRNKSDGSLPGFYLTCIYQDGYKISLHCKQLYAIIIRAQVSSSKAGWVEILARVFFVSGNGVVWLSSISAGIIR